MALKLFNRNAICGWSIFAFTLLAVITTLAWSTNLKAYHGLSYRVRGTFIPSMKNLYDNTRGYMLEKRRTIDVSGLHPGQPPYRPMNSCPRNDLPGNGRNLTIVLNITDFEHVEEEIFKPEELVNARKVTREASESISGVYLNHNQTTFMLNDVLSKRVRVRDYWYLPGGHWIPADCTPRWKVAIIIPFRDRSVHLAILLRHLVPFMKAQFLEFGIFIIDQANDLKFNRAMLMNVGYLEGQNFTQWDCFIFHDVDHIPLSHDNYYGCENMPRHFISGDDQWNYKILYNDLFGGVTGFTPTQVANFNGFPNVYWGWGGEDDEIMKRSQGIGLTRTRPKGQMGYYNVIPHHHKSSPKNEVRFCLLKHFRQRLHTDGLNNIKYDRPLVSLLPLYVNISVDIQHLPWNGEKWLDCKGGA